MSNIPTPHNACADQSLIAKVVLMPGDPLRAKYIADNFLTDVICFTSVRNVYGYTGKYNGKKISVMASGMGQPSIGIYSYELYKNYGVDTIVRIGTAGSYDKKLEVLDTVIVSDAYSESTFAKVAYGYKSHIAKPKTKINNQLIKAAEKLNIKLKEGRCHSSDVFYGTNPNYWKEVNEKYGCSCVEMESFALFATAKYLGRNAACILTISDSFVDDKIISAEQRQTGLNNMIKIALELAKN